MKRVLSIMLALMLAFTILSGVTAFADDEYDVVATLVNEDYSTTMAKYTSTTGWSEFRKTGATGKRVEFRAPFAATGAIVDPSEIDANIREGLTSAKVFKVPATGTNPMFRFRNTFSATAEDMVRIKFRIYLDGTSNPAVTSFNAYFQMQNTSTGSTGATFVQNNITIPVGQWCDVTVIEMEDAVHGGLKVTLQDSTGNGAYPTTVYLDGNVVVETIKVAESNAAKVAADKAALSLGNTSAVTNNLTLPTQGENGSTITWATSDASVITNEGVITPGITAKTAKLTATLMLGNVTDTKEFNITLAAIPAASLASCFKNNMVIQRNQPIDVWGTSAIAGKTVTITLGDSTATTETDSTGQWMVTLPAMSATEPGTGLSLTMSCNDEAATTQTITNVAIGEIILAAGQSNMNRSVYFLHDTTLEEFAEDSAEVKAAVANLSNVDVRMLNFNDTKINTFTWGRLSRYSSENGTRADNVYYRSVIGFMTAYKLAVQENITVAFADAAYGGSVVRAFLSPEKIASRPEYADFKPEDPLETDFLVRRRQASGLYNIWLTHIKGMKFGSVIYYQGGSDAMENVTQELYHKMLTDLINQFRSDYGNANLPVIICQITPHSHANFVAVRQAQLDAVNDMDNVYLVTTADLGPTEAEFELAGDNSTKIQDATNHPINKMPVVNRCFNVIKYAVLGEDVDYNSPLYKSMTVAGNTATLTIEIGADYLKTSDGEAVTGFQVAGKDGIFYDATATINGNKITVSSENVTSPVEVRYSYVSWAEDNRATLGGNVVNSADIPMGPFKAQAPNVAITNVTGSGYSYTVNLSNESYNTAPGFVVAALYDGDEFIQVRTAQFSIDERKGATKTVTFTPDSALSNPNVKIMAWKSMTTIVPYCAAVER